MSSINPLDSIRNLSSRLKVLPEEGPVAITEKVQTEGQIPSVLATYLSDYIGKLDDIQFQLAQVPSASTNTINSRSLGEILGTSNLISAGASKAYDPDFLEGDPLTYRLSYHLGGLDRRESKLAIHCRPENTWFWEEVYTGHNQGRQVRDKEEISTALQQYVNHSYFEQLQTILDHLNEMIHLFTRNDESLAGILSVHDDEAEIQASDTGILTSVRENLQNAILKSIKTIEAMVKHCDQNTKNALSLVASSYYNIAAAIKNEGNVLETITPALAEDGLLKRMGLED